MSAASARGLTTLSELTRAARDEIARALARGEARVPTLPPLDGRDPTPPAHADAVDEEPAAAVESSAPYLPEDGTPGHEDERPPVNNARRQEPEQDRRSPAERLADELAALRPHERLAAVRFYLDGESVNSIAQLFDIARGDAVALLESVTAVLAPIVGEYDLPDFAAEVDEVEVMTR